MKKLAIFGSGGFAKELVDLAIDQGYRHIFFLERNAKDDDTLLGFPILPVPQACFVAKAIFVHAVLSDKRPVKRSKLFACRKGGNRRVNSLKWYP